MKTSERYANLAQKCEQNGAWRNAAYWWFSAYKATCDGKKADEYLHNSNMCIQKAD